MEYNVNQVIGLDEIIQGENLRERIEVNRVFSPEELQHSEGVRREAYKENLLKAASDVRKQEERGMIA